MKKLRKILLIDDDDTTCFLTKEVLERMDVAVEIDCVHDGMQGIQYLLKHIINATPPELIFLDNKMPIMDGFEFLESFKDLGLLKRVNICIVMLTTSMHKKDLERAASYSNSLQGYLFKPLQEDSVKQVINSITL